MSQDCHQAAGQCFCRAYTKVNPTNDAHLDSVSMIAFLEHQAANPSNNTISEPKESALESTINISPSPLTGQDVPIDCQPGTTLQSGRDDHLMITIQIKEILKCVS